MVKTGGPAFPTPAHNLTNDGITLRDWFAALAMQGLLTSTEESDTGVIARDAYWMADAMLKQREKS